MNWLINFVGKWAVGRRTKAAGICCFALALLGVVVNIDPSLLPMVDVMSWDTIGGWVALGFAAFGIGGKADKAIEAVKENTAAVEATNGMPETTRAVKQRIVTPELTDEQRDAINSN